MTDIPTIEDLKKIQRDEDLNDFHVVWIGPSWFVIAHTDEERASIDLHQCELHEWMHSLSEAPHEPGYYAVMPHMPDPYSEPYGADPFDFVPLDA